MLEFIFDFAIDLLSELLMYAFFEGSDDGLSPSGKQQPDHSRGGLL